jgi:hypothetical protein
MFKIISMSVAASLMLISTPTLANCGGHCQQAKVCVAQVTAKHLPQKDQQHAEYTKCMADPHNYK